MRIMVAGDFADEDADPSIMIPLTEDDLDISFLIGDFTYRADVSMESFSMLKGIVSKPSIFVPGYRELLCGHKSVNRILADCMSLESSLGYDTRLGYCYVTDIMGFRIITATLWPDFFLYEDENLAAVAMDMFYQEYLTDSKGRMDKFFHNDEPITVQWVMNQNRMARDFIMHMAGQKSPSKVIVATYIPPVPWVYSQVHVERDPLLACVSNDDVELLRKAKVWVHGSSSTTGQYSVAGTTLVVNTRRKNPRFDPSYVLEVVST
jgi:hypothetical protein